MAKETAKEIDHEAALWTARLDRGLTPAEEEKLQAWLSSDERRIGAFARMRALSKSSERSVAVSADHQRELVTVRDAQPLNRRRLMQFAAVVFAGAAAAGGAFFIGHSYTRYSTRKGEVRTIALADGSVITLNTASVISVNYSRDRRTIKLIDGEAMFDVVRDAARPFLVTADDLQVKVLGTIFTVRAIASLPAQVLVQEGIVEAHPSSSAQIARLSANMRGVVIAGSFATSTVSSAELQRQIAWREGRIVFAGESLADASIQFARYSDTRIVIDDADLALEEVSGSFRAHDPVGFGRAMAEALRARVAVGQGEVHLYR